MIQLPFNLEEECALLARCYFDALVCCFEVERGAAKVAIAIGMQETALHIQSALHIGFALQTVLCRTNLGSLPSARTILSLPMAVRLGQRCSASALVPVNL